MQTHCGTRTSVRILVALALFAFTGSLGAKCPKSTQLSAKCAPPWGEVAMFMIGSNNIEQTAKRMNVKRTSLSWRPAALKGYKRQFLGLGKGRSHGAVATVVPQKGSEVKGVLLYVPRIDRKGNPTLVRMDKNEGVPTGQYTRKTMKVNCYSGSRKLAGIVNAEVYLLVGSETKPPTGRAAIIGRKNRMKLKRKDPKHRGKYITYKAHNNGMVSMDYIKAVRDMLRCSWGKSYSAAKEFPPAAGQSKLVMFDPSKCTYAGRTDSRGQRYRGACRGSQMFNGKVPKYSALRYVRDHKKIPAAIPKMPSSRSRLAVLPPLIGMASQGNASSMPSVANTTNASASGLGDSAASEPDGQRAGPGRRLLHVFV